MSLSKYREIYKKTGETACLELLAEECTELAHACLKLARKQRGECPTPATQLETVKAIHEEIADYYRKQGKMTEEEIKEKCGLKEHHCEGCCGH
jgi:NTP pyrophosphatase (non-canonical NTP hydrolase)